MSALPLASIIIDNYNYVRFLRDAIDSALNQTYPNVEVIVVDDGSTDDSRKVIATYGDRIVPILKPNEGQGSTFNAGFRASRGSVIYFLDSDDVFLPHTVASTMPAFQQEDVAKLHWPMQVVEEDLTSRNVVFPPSTLPSGDYRQKLLETGPSLISSPTSGNAWARWFLDLVLPLDETIFRLSADMYLFELAPFFGVVATSPQLLSLYRQHGRNGHVNAQLGEKIRREVVYYDTICLALQRRLHIPEDRIRAWQDDSWAHKDARALAAITGLTQEDSCVVLIDDATWDNGPIVGRRRRTVSERDGVYWGPPASDAAAIEQIERLRDQGATDLAITWQAFWWIDGFPRLIRYLEENFQCLERNEAVLLFRLTAGDNAATDRAAP